MVDLLKPYPIGVVRVTTRGCCGKEVTAWDSVGFGRVFSYTENLPPPPPRFWRNGPSLARAASFVDVFVPHTVTQHSG